MEDRESSIRLVMETLHPNVKYYLHLWGNPPIIEIIYKPVHTMSAMSQLKKKIRLDVMGFINEKVVVILSSDHINEWIRQKNER